MRIRSAGARALHLLVLLGSLLDAAGHELLCRDEAARPGVGAGMSISGAQIDPGEERRGDDCPCCGLCSARVSLCTASTIDPALVFTEALPGTRAALFIKPWPADHLSRGPPAR